jgi:2-hydroxy-6-oxonona-2,4-dienedioate hydrolase
MLLKLNRTEPRRLERLLVGFASLVILTPTPGAAGQLTPPMPPEKVISVYGQHIYFYEAGQGSDLIFLHGLGAEGSNWAANFGFFAQKYHVYALDQIGFGNSDKPLIDYKIQTFVEFLQAFMQEQSISKATLVGNSLGGWIAADFAARYPEMVEKLVLVDAAGMRPQDPAARLPVDLNPSSLAGMRKILESIVYDKHWVTDELVRQAFERHMKIGDGYTIQRVLAGILGDNQWENDKLGSIHAPTLLLWGHDDALIPLSSGERFQKAIPGAKLVVLNECGHIPQVEKPAEFNAELVKFLAEP